MILAGMVSSKQDDMSFTGSVRSKSEGAGTLRRCPSEGH